MRFFDRKKELALLRTIREESFKGSSMTILKGRRRVGKTTHLQEANGERDYLYLFVGVEGSSGLREEVQSECPLHPEGQFPPFLVQVRVEVPVAD